MTSVPMNARSELIRRRSPGVDMLRNSFDGFVVETRRRFQAAVPASNHPALRPTRGSGFGFVGPTLMVGDGAALEDDEEDDLVEAQPAAITATASERRESCLTGGIESGKRMRDEGAVASTSWSPNGVR